ncbi:unnamed protein product [Urochloa decumbens]|uniref:NAC domain-containing protein n=1 Tax=Urochloa decumbens TaxID=240449 RepID=A0ABC9BQL5_9POAL
MQSPAATEAELVDALAQRKRGLPPLASQPFTVHDDVFIYNSDPSRLYDKYGGGADSSGCVYLFCDMFSCLDCWKVAAGTQPVLDSGGAVVGWKDTLVYHEGTRWLPRIRWAMDEFEVEYQEGFEFSLRRMHLYRLRRLDATS